MNGAPRASFSREWDRGFERVYVLRWTRTRHLYDSRTRSWPKYFALCILISASPLILNFALRGLWPVLALQGAHENGWLAAIGVIDFIMLLCASGAWSYVRRRAHEIDSLVFDPLDCAALASSLDSYLAHRKQAVLPAVLGTTALAFLFLARNDIRAVLEIGPASYLSLVLSGIIGGNVSYFLFIGSTILRTVLRARHLHIRWQDPASTPGMRLIAETIALSAMLLLFGSAAVTVLGFILPQTVPSVAVRCALVAFMLYALVIIVRLVVGPLFDLQRAISRSIDGTLGVLGSKIGSLDSYLHSEGETRAQQDELITLYCTVSRSARLPFSTVAIVQYGAALLATLLAFCLGLIYK